MSSLMVVLAGCGGKSDSSSESTPSGPVLLSFSRSGGVAGTFDTLIVRDGGASEISEEIGGAVTARFQLPPEQLARLRREFAAAHFETVGSALSSGCADCFLYVITYRGYTIRRDEASLPAKMKPLVATLQAIVDAHD
jgi:hypothetical protein